MRVKKLLAYCMVSLLILTVGCGIFNRPRTENGYYVSHYYACGPDAVSKALSQYITILRTTKQISQDIQDSSNTWRFLASIIDKKGVQIINDLFKTLKNNTLNSIQELIILEVSLRIINADNKHDENEIKFIHFLRANLKLHDEEIVDRFGELEILHTSSYIKNVAKEQNNNGFTEKLTLPEINEIKNIKFNLE